MSFDIDVDVDRSVARAWRTFRFRLAACIAELSDEDRVELSCEDLVGGAAVAPTTDPVDATTADGETAGTEPVGPTGLTIERFDRELLLYRSGFDDIAEPRSVATFAGRDETAVAAAAVRALQHDLGVIHPAFLTAMVATADGSILTRADVVEGAEQGHGLGGAPGVRVQSPTHLRELTYGVIERLVGAPVKVDRSGDVVLDSLPVRAHVRARADAPMIELILSMRRVASFEAGLAEANALNASGPLIKFTVVDGQLVGRVELWCSWFVADYVEATLGLALDRLGVLLAGTSDGSESPGGSDADLGRPTLVESAVDPVGCDRTGPDAADGAADDDAAPRPKRADAAGSELGAADDDPAPAPQRADAAGPERGAADDDPAPAPQRADAAGPERGAVAAFEGLADLAELTNLAELAELAELARLAGHDELPDLADIVGRAAIVFETPAPTRTLPTRRDALRQAARARRRGARAQGGDAADRSADRADQAHRSDRIGVEVGIGGDSGAGAAGPSAAERADARLCTELMTLLHLDPHGQGEVDPELAAKVCHFDAPLILDCIRVCEGQVIEWSTSATAARAADRDDAEEAAACDVESHAWQATVDVLRAALRVTVEQA